MALTVRYLTNSAYGYPRGHTRTYLPRRLCCIHITGNPSNQGPNAATGERAYANRPGSDGPSAHAYINRDGSGVICINRQAYAAWNNGDIQNPNLAIPGVPQVAAMVGTAHNPNEDYWLEIECVGYAAAAGQITEAQLDTVAALIAEDAIRTGLPINRSTVHTHADLNSVNRPNCAFLPATREARMAQLIAKANALLPVSDMDFEYKAERWVLDGNAANKVTTLGAPIVNGQPDYGSRLALVSDSGGANPRLSPIPRNRLTVPDESLTDEFYDALSKYTIPDNYNEGVTAAAAKALTAKR